MSSGRSGAMMRYGLRKPSPVNSLTVGPCTISLNRSPNPVPSVRSGVAVRPTVHELEQCLITLRYEAAVEWWASSIASRSGGGSRSSLRASVCIDATCTRAFEIDRPEAIMPCSTPLSHRSSDSCLSSSRRWHTNQHVMPRSTEAVRSMWAIITDLPEPVGLWSSTLRCFFRAALASPTVVAWYSRSTGVFDTNDITPPNR